MAEIKSVITPTKWEGSPDVESQMLNSVNKGQSLGNSEWNETSSEDQGDACKKYITTRDHALAIIVLVVDPSLLYLPKDPRAIWIKLKEQFQ